MSPMVEEILQAIVTAGPAIGQAIIALIQAVSGKSPSNTAAIHAAISKALEEHQAAKAKEA